MRLMRRSFGSVLRSSVNLRICVGAVVFGGMGEGGQYCEEGLDVEYRTKTIANSIPPVGNKHQKARPTWYVNK